MITYDKLNKMIKREIDLFLEIICKNRDVKNWELSNLFEDGITYFIEEDFNIDDTKCKAIVSIDNSERQCSRKHKFNEYCGLHYNKLKKYKSIKNLLNSLLYEQTVYIKYYENNEDVLKNLFDMDSFEYIKE